MLEQTVAAWAGQPTQARAKFFVDGTVGGGGHSERLLQVEPNAVLLCLDRDTDVRIKLNYYDVATIANQ